VFWLEVRFDFPHLLTGLSYCWWGFATVDIMETKVVTVNANTSVEEACDVRSRVCHVPMVLTVGLVDTIIGGYRMSRCCRL